VDTSTGAAYAFADSVLHNLVQGETVLLDLVNERYFGLDAVGTAIVTRLTQQPFEDALRDLALDYEVDAAVLRHDVHQLLASLVEAGLLKRLDA